MNAERALVRLRSDAQDGLLLGRPQIESVDDLGSATRRAFDFEDAQLELRAALRSLEIEPGVDRRERRVLRDRSDVEQAAGLLSAGRPGGSEHAAVGLQRDGAGGDRPNGIEQVRAGVADGFVRDDRQRADRLRVQLDLGVKLIARWRRYRSAIWRPRASTCAAC